LRGPETENKELDRLHPGSQ